MSNNDRHVINHTEDELYEHISKKYKNNHGEYDKSKIKQFREDFRTHNSDVRSKQGHLRESNLKYKNSYIHF